MSNNYKIPKSKIPDLSFMGLFHSEMINPLALIISMYDGDIPSYKRYKENFSKEKVIDYLRENGAQIVQSAEDVLIAKTVEELEEDSGDPLYIGEDIIIPNLEFEESKLYFYKDNFVYVSIGDGGKHKDKCTLTFYYPNGCECVDTEFHDFLDLERKPNVFMVNHEYGGFNFSKFNINVPQTFDLDLNYGEDFSDISKKIIESLHENSSGLYMFHGLPGTGKTTYIKYLASVLKKDVIFFPTSFVDEITNPSILTLLKKKQDCILILEDAEKVLTKRNLSDQPSLVSTLLNMTDGILGDVLKLNVIVTYNCDRQDIDEALLRKGRLKAEYSFQGLTEKQAAKLIKKLDLNIKPRDNMTLADIYYAESDEKLIGNIKNLEKPKIGFGQ
jgi:hypothetical protein